MIALLTRLDTLLSRIPHELLALLARLSVGTLFLRSGLLKVDGWAAGTTLTLRGATEGVWTPVVCGGQSGWISSQYLR